MLFHEQVNFVRNAINQVIFERHPVVHVLPIAWLAEENLLTISPPGCGKSMLADVWAQCWKDIKYFSIQNNPFSKLDDVEGYIDSKEYKENGIIRRMRDNFATKAHFVNLDELPRTEAVLPCYLKLLNEKVYTENGQWFKAALRMAFASGNSDLPATHEALKDRFSLVFFLSGMSLECKRVLWDDEKILSLPEDMKFTLQQFDTERQKIKLVNVPEDVKLCVDNILMELEGDNIIISDRAYRKMSKISRASAVCEGRSEVTFDDIWLMRNVFARTESQYPKVCEVLRRYVNQDLDNILKTYDEFVTVYKEWSADSNGKRNARLFEGQAREIGDTFKKISPRDINKAEFQRCLKDITRFHHELNTCAQNEIRAGKLAR